MKKRLLLTTVFVSLFVLLIIALGGFAHQSIRIQLKNGVAIEIQPASLWSSARGTSCSIIIRGMSSTTNRVDLWQDIYDRPLLLIPSSSGKTLLCLYDWDTDTPLFRIDPARAYKPVTNTWHRVNAIVCSSTCSVEEANFQDWLEANDYLGKLSLEAFGQQAVPNLDIGIFRFGRSIEAKLRMEHCLEDHLKYMRARRLSHWPGDIAQWID